MQIVKFVAMAILFAILTPGVLVWLPTGSSKKCCRNCSRYCLCRSLVFNS